MKDLLLGYDSKTGEPIYIPTEAFKTHFHLIGGTGKGKTTAIHTILHSLLRDRDKPCFFIFDRMGNLSYELLLWIASKYSASSIRDRLVYIEPAREDVVLGFNPLLYDTSNNCYYKVARATEIILRAWEDVDIQKMPRLARWTFNSFYAAAQLGLTIADCVHFLMPGSDYHRRLLNCLPPRLHAEWSEVIDSNSPRAVLELLDSSRNRLKPYFESDILRRMFGSTQSHLDVIRFMREGKIVILNLAPKGKLSTQLADAIGALILNEILATVRSLPPYERYPTYLFLDEFQNFVGPDIAAALPEVRQLGLRLVLSHQSFDQLKRGDYDLTTMIFQAQSRMVFGLQGLDADIVAHELASLTYDPKRVKEELYTRRQWLTGHRLIELTSRSNSDTFSEQWSRDYGQGWSTNRNITHGILRDIEAEGTGETRSERSGSGGGTAHGSTVGVSQGILPVYEQFLELCSRTFYTFDEQKNIWARDVRQLRRGMTLLRLVDDPAIHEVDVKRSAPGHLAWDPEMLYRKYPKAIDDVERMLEANFRSEFFMSPAAIDAEIQRRLEAVVRPQIAIPARSAEASPPAPPAENLFT